MLPVCLSSRLLVFLVVLAGPMLVDVRRRLIKLAWVEVPGVERRVGGVGIDLVSQPGLIACSTDSGSGAASHSSR